MFFSRKRYKALDDTLLVEKIATGDEAAFREILSRYQAGVLNYAVKFTGEIGLAEDVVQETFLRLYRVAENMHPSGNVRAYIYRIARNLCIDLSRKKSPELPGVLPETIDPKTPFDKFVRKEEEEILLAAVLKLPEKQKTALLLRHREGLTYKEIAAVMSLSLSSVESLLVRARKKLCSMTEKNTILNKAENESFRAARIKSASGGPAGGQTFKKFDK